SALGGILAVVGVLLVVVTPFVNLGALRTALLTRTPKHAPTPAALEELPPRMMREIVGQRVAELTVAPLVPPAPERTPHNTKVIVHLEVVEKVMRLADGVD